MHVGIAGEVRCVVTKADGKVKTDTGFQKNLILNQGLDFFGGGRGVSINASCAIGSGNSTPVVTQTKLDSFLALTSGTDTTSNYSYVDEGDDLYKMWEQKKYRFTGLDDANISEVGLVSTGSSSANYYLTTRALIKDSAGAPTSISVKTGETLDIYYKIHKIINTTDKSFVVNVLDGNGGSVPYNVVIRPAFVGNSTMLSVTSPLTVDSRHQEGNQDYSWSTSPDEPQSISAGVKKTGNVERISNYGTTLSTYISGEFKRVLTINLGLNYGNTYPLRTLADGQGWTASWTTQKLFPFQIRFGSVADDSPIVKTNKDTLSIPLEFSWGRFEGEL